MISTTKNNARKKQLGSNQLDSESSSPEDSSELFKSQWLYNAAVGA
jgi:hypothetical protein